MMAPSPQALELVMNLLANKTLSLCRQHPQLWLPTIIANFVAHGLALMQRSVPHNLGLWMMRTRQTSVLGGATEIEFDPQRLQLAYISSGVTRFTLHGLTFVVWITALLLTFRSVRRILAPENPQPPLKTYARGIFRLSLLMALLSTAMIFLLPFTQQLFDNWFPHYRAAQFNDSLDRLLWLGSTLVIVYFVTPLYLRLLRTPIRDRLPIEVVATGRKVVMLATLATSVLSFLVSRLPLSAAHSYGESLAVGLLTSYIIATPFLPQYVAESLLVAESSGTAVLVADAASE